MELLVSALLFAHVLSGVIALVTALVAISNRKGSSNHRLVGKIFFWAMLAVGVTAIPVTFIRPNAFLFAIALFSFYMAFAGYRRGKTKFTAQPVDAIAAYAMLITAVGMIGYGIFLALNVSSIGWALVAFGGIGLNFSIDDIRELKKQLPHHEKVMRHLQHMLGGTIATITAVLVQQVSPLIPNALGQTALWLAPTIIITPLIFIWSARVAKTKRYRLFPKG